jgi:N-acetylmuramoyl-L-alanine amidase
MNKKYTGLVFHVALFGCLLIALGNASSLVAQETENSYALKTVVIDAGHGGKDPGSLGRLTTEKDVVLAIALKVGKYIEDQIPGIRVVYTRKTDDFVPLHQRAEIANANKADLFISIHANGNQNNLVSGTESLVLGLHRADENFEVAKKENSVILLEDDYTTKYEGFDPNSPESYIIFSLMQNLYFEQSINLAALVQDQFRDRAQRKDRGVKQQGLLVLARTSMPGILVETGFITNPEEEKYLMSEKGQDYIASAIFRAFRDYKKIVESRSSMMMASHFQQSADTLDNPREQAGDTNGMQSRLPVNNNNTTPVSFEKVEFKVQIAASSKSIRDNAHVFKGFEDICEYRAGNFYKYAVGSSPTFQGIIAYSREIKEQFPDAFIIAVKNGEIIPLDQALKESQQITSNN